MREIEFFVGCLTYPVSFHLCRYGLIRQVFVKRINGSLSDIVNLFTEKSTTKERLDN